MGVETLQNANGYLDCKNGSFVSQNSYFLTNKFITSVFYNNYHYYREMTSGLTNDHHHMNTRNK